jgi:hypothetical protein
VTGAETCELAIALHLVGETAAAAKLVRDMQHLRHTDGGYWTGWQFEAGTHWPQERSTWTAAAVILAVDVIGGGVTEATFRGDHLPEGLLVPDLETVGGVGGAGGAPVGLGCGCGSGDPLQHPQRSCA